MFMYLFNYLYYIYNYITIQKYNNLYKIYNNNYIYINM